MGKFLSKLDKLAKKGSGFGGKLGLISRTVDALIPDASASGVKTAKLGQETTSGADSTAPTGQMKVLETGASATASTSSASDKKTLSQKWGSLPMWAKGSVIAGGAGLVFMLIKKMSHKGGMSYKRKY